MKFPYPIKSFDKDKKRVLHNIKSSLLTLNLISHYFDFLNQFDVDFCFCVDDCKVIRDYFERLLGVVDKLEYSELMSSEKSD